MWSLVILTLSLRRSSCIKFWERWWSAWVFLFLGYIMLLGWQWRISGVIRNQQKHLIGFLGHNIFISGRLHSVVLVCSRFGILPVLPSNLSDWCYLNDISEMLRFVSVLSFAFFENGLLAQSVKTDFRSCQSMKQF